MTPSLSDPCQHPARNGHHEVYTSKHGPFCRACGAGALSEEVCDEPTADTDAPDMLPDDIASALTMAQGEIARLKKELIQSHADRLRFQSEACLLARKLVQIRELTEL